MTSVPDLLIEHGVAVIFAWAFVVQAGVPAPAIPKQLHLRAFSATPMGRAAFPTHSIFCRSAAPRI